MEAIVVHSGSESIQAKAAQIRQTIMISSAVHEAISSKCHSGFQSERSTIASPWAECQLCDLEKLEERAEVSCASFEQYFLYEPMEVRSNS